MASQSQAGMSNLLLTIRVRGRVIVASDGFRAPLKGRFFFLYLLLAWQRRAPGSPDSGYVGCDLIRRLPHWERNNLASVGKQVRRHILEMERKGRNLIEYRERIKGPFRLCSPGRAIRFDVPLGEVRRLLDIPLGRGPGRQEHAQALYGFVQTICEGNAAFDAGALDLGRAAYEQALKEAFTPEQSVTALQKVGRVLERQGQYDRAQALFSRALRLQHRHPELDDSARARTHLFLGWVEYRRGRYAQARDHYYRAMDLARGKHDDWVLGHLYNGLGLIEKRDDDYGEALAFFRTALDYWCRADYAYGIAAAYANIGSTHARWGNHLRDHRVTNQARVQYRRAVEWLERCLEFSVRARLGEDTSEAQGMLAEVHLELGNLQEAWPMARAAYEAAQRAGNELDLASATLILAKLHASHGDPEQARVLLGEAKTRFEQLGHKERSKKIEHLLASAST